MNEDHQPVGRPAITPEQLHDLREKAGKATKGEWADPQHFDFQTEPLSIVQPAQADRNGGFKVANLYGPDREANAAYIVAAQPTTVLALLDRIEELTTTLYRAQEALGEYACHIGDKYPCMRLPDQCRAECGKAAGDAALLIDKALSGEKQ